MKRAFLRPSMNLPKEFSRYRIINEKLAENSTQLEEIGRPAPYLRSRVPNDRADRRDRSERYLSAKGRKSLPWRNDRSISSVIFLTIDCDCRSIAFISFLIKMIRARRRNKRARKAQLSKDEIPLLSHYIAFRITNRSQEPNLSRGMKKCTFFFFVLFRRYKSLPTVGKIPIEFLIHPRNVSAINLFPICGVSWQLAVTRWCVLLHRVSNSIYKRYGERGTFRLSSCMFLASKLS